MAEIVPRIVEIIVERRATTKVFERAVIIALSVNSFLYQIRLKESKDPLSLDELKEKTIRTIIGKYKNK